MTGGSQAASESLWERDKLTGDWGGLRTTSSRHGVEFGINYTGGGVGNVSGGVRTGAGYEGRVELSVDTDLEKLVGWKGATAHVTVYQIHHVRATPAADYLGGLALADPSDIEALETTRLFTLWYQQNMLDDKLSVRVGQLAADDEFMIASTSTSLMDSTFGWPTLLAANMTNGGPVYLLATPGVRVKVSPMNELAVLAALFSGNPAGAGCRDAPQVCNRHGTTFSTSGGALWLGEVQYAVNQGKNATGLAGAYKIGGWYADTHFPDQHFGRDAAGAVVSLASPAAVGPLDHQGIGECTA